MTIRIPPPLHPALAGLQAPGLAPAGLAPAVAPAGPLAEAAASASVATAAPAGLAFEGWPASPGAPVVRGDRPYPGDAGDPRAVADAIAGLLFDQG
ncbi:MAG: hypothetical protein RJA99_3820 [Pseudomonadota bacterium]|jgi:hypothetical protein